MKTYSEKLRDPRWQKLRLEIMERDRFQCRLCRDTEKTLNVHHSFYSKGWNPWDYPNASLVTACEDCHKLIEARRQSILEATANPFVQLAVLQLCHATKADCFPYPRGASFLIQSVVEFLQCCEFGDDETDLEVITTPIDRAFSLVIESMIAMKMERVNDARQLMRSEKSLDELIAEAPETPDEKEEL